MKKIYSLTALITTLAAIALLASCNLPGGTTITTSPESPDAASTYAAQTVAAELTRLAPTASSTLEIPANTPTNTNTLTASPTNTQISTPTFTVIPCNVATYNSATIDVTIPDYTIMSPGQTFTKIWRIINAGSCTWTTSYKASFDSGTGMGVAAGYSKALPGVVPPNQTVDIAVNLTAPAASGTYTGTWSLRDPSNQVMMTFFVIIKVAAPTTVTLAPVNAGVESGTIREGGGPFPDYTIGESNADMTKAVQAFLSYDISGIPSNATITEIKFDFHLYSTEGDPFGHLGILNAYVTNYGPTLEPADFVAGFPGGNIADWGSTAALNVIEVSPELKAALQAIIGSTRLQLRLQFAGSNADAEKDRITFTNPSLIISYTTP